MMRLVLLGLLVAVFGCDPTSTSNPAVDAADPLGSDARADAEAPPSTHDGSSTLDAGAEATGRADGGTGGATASPCEPYDASPLYRPREDTVEVGPDDDWMSAIEEARPGTEIRLADGDYPLGDRYAVRVPDAVTVRSASGNRNAVTLRGAGYDVPSEGLMVVGSDVTIAELSMTGMRNHAISIKSEEDAQAPHLYNLRLYDIGTQHVKLSAGGVSRDGVIACSSIGYTPGGVQGDYVNAIDLHRAVGWTIRDNYIYNIAGDGSGCEVDVDCGSYISGPAILVWNEAADTVVERNVIVDSFRGIALGLGRGHRGGVVRNNFICRAGEGDAGIELNTASEVLVAHNTVIVTGYPGAIEVSSGDGVRLVNNLISAPPWDRGGASFVEDGNLHDASTAYLRTASCDAPHLADDTAAEGAGVALTSAEVGDDIDTDPRFEPRDVGCDQR